MSADPAAGPGRSSAISRPVRGVLVATGLLAWTAGAVAVFISGNGPGVVALVGSGIVAMLLGLMGRWPQRVVVSGNEVGWDEVKEAVESSIEATQRDPDAAAAVSELRILLDRLERLRLTGRVPEHPAAGYDCALRAAVQRLLPGATLVDADRRSRDVPDLTVRVDGCTLFVESKWRQDVARPMEGSTLGRLRAVVGRHGRLLVVSNALDVARAGEVAQGLFGRRCQVITWRDARDDGALAQALQDLLTGLSS